MPPRPTSQPVRANIEQAALAEFLEHGYDASTLEDVADRVGLTRQALLYHYRSKEALLESLLRPGFAAMRTMLEELEARAAAARATATTPLPTAEEQRYILRRLVDNACEHRAAYALVSRFTTRRTILDLGAVVRSNSARVAALLAGDAFETDRATRIRVIACIGALGGTMGARLEVALDTDQDKEVLVDALMALLTTAS
jgi:AcrR family transcriptional regulator